MFDKFHVLRLMSEAVDRVRRQEHKKLRAQHDEVLTGTKYLWLYHPDRIPEAQLPRFEELRRMDLQVSRAWALKENLRQLWTYRREGWARRFFRRWYFWATHSRLPPVIAVARTLKRRLDNILTYLRHRITNALNEAVNAQVEKSSAWPEAIATAPTSRPPSTSIAADSTSIRDHNMLGLPTVIPDEPEILG